VANDVEFELADSHSEQQLISELADHFPLAADGTARETLAFFDTFDWRLYQAELLLYQTGNEFLLCALSDNHIIHRQAIAVQPRFVWDLSEGALKSRLEPIVKMRALLKLVEVRLSSTSLRVLNDDRKTFVRILFEALESKDQADLRVSEKYIRLKPVRGYDKQADRVIRHFEAVGLVRGQNGHFQRVLASSGRTPGDYSTKLDLQFDPQMRADEATRIILRHQLQVLRWNEEGIKQDFDTEFLHDFRVAVRRTRAALSQIKGVFPEQPTHRFKADFAYIGQLTNDLRDLDVYLLAEDAYKAMLPAYLSDDISPLFDYLKQKRATALQQVISGLNSEAYAKILHSWEDFLTEPIPASSSAPNAVLPIIEVARRRIYNKYRRVVKWDNQILEDTEDKQLHALRIECKKLRYLLEFFANLFPPKDIAASVKQLKRLQTNLGDFNDLCVQEDYLLHIAGEIPITSSDARKVFLATGCLIGTLRQERIPVKAKFSTTFARFAAPDNKKRFKKLFAGEG
jgi:CHAD domain-containing protein